MSAAASVSVILGAAALAVLGRNEHGLDVGLMLTGRWAFLLFWPAYAGGGLAALVGRRAAFIGRHGRALGLAFAAAMPAHAGLIVWLCAIGAAPAAGVFVIFGPALVCVAALAVFSLPGAQRWLGRTSWWLLRFVAMNYIAYAFAIDFLRDPFSGGVKHALLYAPFAVLSVVGFVAYAFGLVALARKRKDSSFSEEKEAKRLLFSGGG
jgi:uncharacterized membrane protein